MIDQDISNELHTLAATVNEPFDLAALHRRITMHSRRRTAVKVGFAGAGVAALVGGLLVVEQRPSASPTDLAAGTATESASSAVVLPGCDVVLADLQAAKSEVPHVAKPITNEPAVVAEGTSNGFKGVVTITSIDGSQLSFTSDELVNALPTDGVATLDGTTEWVDGLTALETAPTLQVGQQVGLATTQATDGVDHVIFVDVESEVTQPDATKETPGPDLPAGATGKSTGTIVASDATSISVTLVDDAVNATTVSIDLAGTPVYAGDVVCAPGSLPVGGSVGVAYHFGDNGAVVADSVALP